MIATPLRKREREGENGDEEKIRERKEGRGGLVKMRDAARVNSTRLETHALAFAGTSEDVPDFPSCVRPSNKIAWWRKDRLFGGGNGEGVGVRRARWNESAVTRNKRGGDPKLLVEVHEARGRERERPLRRGWE